MKSTMVMDRRRFIAAFSGGVLTSAISTSRGASPGDSPSARRWPAVQNLLARYVSDGMVAGAAMAISFGNEPFAYPAAGKLALDSAAPFDENSLCRIYSVTKNVTRTATLLLVEDGKLSLDQPVAEVLPEFRALRVAIDIEKGLESRPAATAMTMRHLITDTSDSAVGRPGPIAATRCTRCIANGESHPVISARG